MRFFFNQLETKTLGETCLLDAECGGDHVYCDNNRCMCIAGYTGLEGDSGCQVTSNLNMIGTYTDHVTQCAGR